MYRRLWPLISGFGILHFFLDTPRRGGAGAPRTGGAAGQKRTHYLARVCCWWRGLAATVALVPQATKVGMDAFRIQAVHEHSSRRGC